MINFNGTITDQSDQLINNRAFLYGDSVFETKDGSKYTYSGWGINIFGGYQWYFDNKISVSIGLGPSYGNASKTSEDINNSSVYGEDVEDYTEENKFRLISPIPLLLVGYTF